MFYPLLVLIALVLVSVSVSSVSLSSTAGVHTVSQGNLEFVTDASGLVKLFRNGNFLGSFGFALKGNVNSQERFLASWSTTWSWQVLSNTDSNVTVLGSTSWQGLDWEQSWFFSETEQKFANRLTNNTGFDVIDTSFYYVVRFDPANVSCLQYVDNFGVGREYCFEQDITITQNLGQYLKRINFVDTVFNFRDLVDSGFEFNYLFAGQLNNVNPTMAGQGFIIGVTKNNGLFPNGASIVLDPSVIDSSPLSKTSYGNTIVRDSSGSIWVVHEETVSASNTDVFISKSIDNGLTFTTFNLTNSTDFNFSLVHIDINSTDGLIIGYDKTIIADNNTQFFITTCSAGGCDAASEFLTDIDVSQCGATDCTNGNITVDVNDFTHVTYVGASVFYRRNTGYVGSAFGAEETAITVSSVSGRDGTQVLVAKNGSNRKLAIANSSNAQVNVAYFNGSAWQTSFILNATSDGVFQPATGFAGYDGNFYIAYTEANGNNGVDGGTPKNIHFRQCEVGTCSILGDFSSDLNITTSPGQNDSFVSLFQADDLNIHLVSSARSQDPDANIHHYVRLPDATWTTSSIADGNLLFSDANRTFAPLLRNREYVGSALDGFTSLPVGALTLDYVFLTSINSNGDPSTLLFDSNSLGDVNGVIANFTSTPPSPYVLDPENGITNVGVDFNSISTELGILDINYTWFVDDVNVSSDQNYHRDFNGTDNDFNIALLVQGNDGTSSFSSQTDQNVLLRENAQDIDINFVFNPEATLADINFGVTADSGTSTINFAVWGFPNDNNLSGLVVNQQYRVGDDRQVCVVVNTAGDTNKLHCENFFTTRVIAKIPLNVTSLAEITPFDVSVNVVPAQSFTGVSVDQNFWFFYQGLDVNAFNMVTDANVEFQVSNNLIILNGFDLNQTIQPYMSEVAAGGISVIFTAKDSITDDIIPGLIIFFSRTVTGVGNTLVQSGVTDSFGRISLSFIPNIDHNFTAEFPIGTIIKTGTYVPETIDATNGVTLLSPSGAVITDANTIGAIDINFLQVNVQVKSDGSVDLNQVVTTDRNISSITITVDHNSVNLFTDTNTVGVSSGGIFGQNVDVNGLSRLIPLVVTVSGTFTDGNLFTSSRGITIVDTPGLVESFETARGELGDTPGTMILLAFIVATILGFYHLYYPSPTGDTSSSFILVAVIFSLATVVGWIDGLSWVFATLAGGAVYFLQRVNK